MRKSQPKAPVTRNTRRAAQDKHKGFVLIFVVLLIAVVGAEMFVLSGISNRMLFDSNTAELEALERNLGAAGLAWAEHNIASDKSGVFGRTVDLDATSLGVSGTTLTVTLGVPRDKKAEIQVNTTCRRGPRMLKRSHTYILDLRPGGDT